MSVNLTDFTCPVIISRYCAIEAGYVNDPLDLGGETNHGITKKLAQQYTTELIKRFGWDKTMKGLSKEMAMFLYKIEFWDKLRCDDLLTVNPLVCDKMFDIAINAGKTRATIFLQEFLNVNNNQQKLWADLTADGGMGNITLGALASYIKNRGQDGLKRLLHALISRQTTYYLDISQGREQNERFTYGWIDRAYTSARTYSEMGWLYH